MFARISTKIIAYFDNLVKISKFKRSYFDVLVKIRPNFKE